MASLPAHPVRFTASEIATIAAKVAETIVQELSYRLTAVCQAALNNAIQETLSSAVEIRQGVADMCEVSAVYPVSAKTIEACVAHPERIGARGARHESQELASIEMKRGGRGESRDENSSAENLEFGDKASASGTTGISPGNYVSASTLPIPPPMSTCCRSTRRGVKSADALPSILSKSVSTAGSDINPAVRPPYGSRNPRRVRTNPARSPFAIACSEALVASGELGPVVFANDTYKEPEDDDDACESLFSRDCTP